MTETHIAQSGTSTEAPAGETWEVIRDDDAPGADRPWRHIVQGVHAAQQQFTAPEPCPTCGCWRHQQITTVVFHGEVGEIFRLASDPGETLTVRRVERPAY